VAEQLGHSNPALTLRVYAHAVPVEGGDLSFVDFGSPPDRAGGPCEGAAGVSRRLYPSPASEGTPEDKSAPELTTRRRYEFLEHETGFEPATLTLARARKSKK